jgi:hypothetical protein
MEINHVTLEREPGQDVTVHINDDVLKFIEDIRRYRGLSTNQAIDYALTDYWYQNFGRCLSACEETISTERYFQRRYIMDELYLDSDDTWDKVVFQYENCSVEVLRKHGIYEDLAEAIVQEIPLTGVDE